MKKIKYLEDMRGHFDKYSYAEIDVYRAYKNAQECNLDYPIFFDSFRSAENAIYVLQALKLSRFYYSCASTRALDDLAALYMRGLKIINVIEKETLLGEKSYSTCCDYVVLIGKRA